MWCRGRIASTFCHYVQAQRLRRCLSVNLRHSRTSLDSLARHTARRHSTASCQCCVHPPRTCWRCSADVQNAPGNFFCPFCHVIQPPNMESTHFEIMDSPPSFNVNTEDLTKKYRELQWKLHPDKFTGKEKDEQNLSDQQSSLVNKAYRTLLKPLSRGLYLLELNGFPILEETTDAHPEFFLDIIETNEQLAQDLSEEQLMKIELENKVHLDQCIQETEAAFNRGDYVEARNVLSRMKYFSNIEDQIKEKKMSLLWH